MNWRQIHRWTSIVFLAIVALCFVSVAVSGPAWILYLPLPPLFLLMGTGLYMFVLPYRKRRATA
ncbi:hypothetical protein [Cryptosporangium sp. NPDC048952]|uniref:hypothetical protein n=1 Tax=Cryptosporangium sp. NPDC048952 TaxID=3363961 RepID=UPI003721C84D